MGDLGVDIFKWLSIIVYTTNGYCLTYQKQHGIVGSFFVKIKSRPDFCRGGFFVSWASASGLRKLNALVADQPEHQKISNLYK